MKTVCCLLLFFVAATSFANEKSDSSKTKLQAGALISLNSNGISSIPAFSLDKPALMAAITLAKGRFSYEPMLAYGLDLKPWFIDNWLNYKIINRKSFELRAGFNISSFFSEYVTTEGNILQSQRYFAYALTGIYKITQHSNITAAYWNDRGQEEGTLKGHFFNLVGERSGINLGKHVLFAATLQLFYIDYDGNNDGLFVAPKLSSSVKNIPFSLFIQATQAIVSNISPFPEFSWNLGLAYAM
jgi:hypothetical protein